MGFYYHQRRSWASERLNVTHKLLERMVGHQTLQQCMRVVLAQEQALLLVAHP